MNKLDLIIRNLEKLQMLWLDPEETKFIAQALAAARELKDELYIKEMEQPTPKQSGKMLITALRFYEVTK